MLVNRWFSRSSIYVLSSSLTPRRSSQLQLLSTPFDSFSIRFSFVMFRCALSCTGYDHPLTPHIAHGSVLPLAIVFSVHTRIVPSVQVGIAAHSCYRFPAPRHTVSNGSFPCSTFSPFTCSTASTEIFHLRMGPMLCKFPSRGSYRHWYFRFLICIPALDNINGASAITHTFSSVRFMYN
jgi:hypothetical protein